MPELLLGVDPESEPPKKMPKMRLLHRTGGGSHPIIEGGEDVE